jgi:hypothetical protein
MPAGPVTLSIEQIEALHRQLSDMRHDINNDLSKIVGASELIKLELMKLSASDPSLPPLKALERLPSLVEQPRKISTMIAGFSLEFEKVLGVTRP